MQPEDYATAMDALEEAGAVDIEERAESWRAEGWGGYSGAASGLGMGAAGMSQGRDALEDRADVAGLGDAGLGAGRDIGTDETIPVVEERLRVGKRDTSYGRVRVRAYVVEEPVSESVTLREERVEVERRPVDRLVQAGDDLFRDRTIEAEETREEAVVQKDARVVEEVGLRKRSETRAETVSDTVRHTEVEVEDGRGAAAGRAASGLSGRPASEVEVEADLTDDADDADDAEDDERRNHPT
jgi:uncharacterized protein (TIGR02271 family)